MVTNGCLINDRYVGEREKNPTINIILNGKRQNAFSLKPGADIYSHHSYFTKDSSQCTKARKKKQGNQIDKEEIKVSLFEDSMII